MPSGARAYSAIPNLSINDDVTIHYLPDFGHVDVMYGTDSLSQVKELRLEWLENRK